MTHEIEETEFRCFTYWVRHYVNKIGIHHVKFYTHLGPMEREGSNAEWEYNYEGGRVDITINEDGIDVLTGDINKDIRHVAKHEVIEAGIVGGLVAIGSDGAGEEKSRAIEHEAHVSHNLIDRLID